MSIKEMVKSQRLATRLLCLFEEEFKKRGLLIGDYLEVYGSASFDEIHGKATQIIESVDTKKFHHHACKSCVYFIYNAKKTYRYCKIGYLRIREEPFYYLESNMNCVKERL